MYIGNEKIPKKANKILLLLLFALVTTKKNFQWLPNGGFRVTSRMTETNKETERILFNAFRLLEMGLSFVLVRMHIQVCR